MKIIHSIQRFPQQVLFMIVLSISVLYWNTLSLNIAEYQSDHDIICLVETQTDDRDEIKLLVYISKLKPASYE